MSSSKFVKFSKDLLFGQLRLYYTGDGYTHTPVTYNGYKPREFSAREGVYDLISNDDKFWVSIFHSSEDDETCKIHIIGFHGVDAFLFSKFSIYIMLSDINGKMEQRKIMFVNTCFEHIQENEVLEFADAHQWYANCRARSKQERYDASETRFSVNVAAELSNKQWTWMVKAAFGVPGESDSELHFSDQCRTMVSTRPKDYRKSLGEFSGVNLGISEESFVMISDIAGDPVLVNGHGVDFAKVIGLHLEDSDDDNWLLSAEFCDDTKRDIVEMISDCVEKGNEIGSKLGYNRARVMTYGRGRNKVRKH